MSTDQKLTAELHKKQVEAYVRERPSYETYAVVLQRVLETACRASFPEALVQARAKGVGSFAEKVARKFGKYPDAVNQLTDLCGARVIVQTTDQVGGVCEFIKANFIVAEEENKENLLAVDQFGYRDMHFIVQLHLDRELGITPNERKAIGTRKAEIQVRTWVEHAWADTLHDRIYKTPITPSSDIKRSAHLLAALMEESDRLFRRLASDLDGLIANYTTNARKAEVQKEIDIQSLVLANETDAGRKPRLTLTMARLLAAKGDHAEAVKRLRPYQTIEGALRCDLLACLGHCLCAANRDNPEGRAYSDGVRALEEALEQCNASGVPFVPNPRTRNSLHARVLHQLARALERVKNQEVRARACYQEAHALEPENPYYLSHMLGYEVFFTHQLTVLSATMRPAIMNAIDTCRRHAARRIELPYSYFAAARLTMLQSKDPEASPTSLSESAAQALALYARGIHHVLSDEHFLPNDLLIAERDWLLKLHFGEPLPSECQQAIDLLSHAEHIRSGTPPEGKNADLTAPVLIVAGGASNMPAQTVKRVRPMLHEVLADFGGTIIAGGTHAGIPGCVGDLANALKAEDKKHFRLIGYRPTRLPDDARTHDGYDKTVLLGERFAAEQIMQNWTDILAAGIKPQDVLLIGLGGGPLAALEYRIALSLGAQVGIVVGTGDAADELLKDPMWAGLSNLLPLPADAATMRAFVLPPKPGKTPNDEVAKEIHRRYLVGNTKNLPPSAQPWETLDEGYRDANRKQAAYSVRILEAAGFQVQKVNKKPTIFRGFTAKEIEYMAQLEHGRWNIERLQKGWRFGPRRDDPNKINPCLVPWRDLSDDFRKFDIEAVLSFPEVLAMEGMQIARRRAQ